jgi:hypothetical protein
VQRTEPAVERTGPSAIVLTCAAGARTCSVSDPGVSVVARTNDARSRRPQLRVPAEGAAGELELVLQPARFGMISVHVR